MEYSVDLVIFNVAHENTSLDLLEITASLHYVFGTGVGSPHKTQKETHAVSSL